MKSPGKKLRHKLNIDDNISDLYIGIVTAEADYRISLLLNRELGISLRSTKPLIKDINKKEIMFSRFSAESKYTETLYDLFSNGRGSEKLLSRLPSIDYLLRIKNKEEKENSEMIIAKIRDIKEVTGVFILNNEKHIESKVLEILP